MGRPPVLSTERPHVLGPTRSFLQALHKTRRPLLMGVLNVTPDSFSDGGRYWTPNAAERHAWDLAEAGADILDLGAESTRPGAEPVPASEEIRRLLPVLRRLRGLAIPISVDTSKPEVAAAVLDEGAGLINDVTGLSDPAMRRLAAERRVPVVIMHSRGNPRTMIRLARYRNVTAEVKRSLLASADRCVHDGLSPRQIILDPGIGFAKTPQQSLQLLRDLPVLADAGYPLLVGPSRKSFITGVLGPLPPQQRIWGTAAAVALAVAGGARVLRVHDVSEMNMVAKVAWAIVQGRISPGATC